MVFVHLSGIFDCISIEYLYLTFILKVMDPDVIVTPDANDAQLDIICNRLTFFKISMWSRIGRLKITNAMGKRIEDFFIGRLVCDVKLSAEEFIKSRSYDLRTLCMEVLKVDEDEVQEILHDNKPFAFDASDTIMELINLNVQVFKLYIANI